ncbi:hypothetical protein V1477_006849, partial [Vespula maculifrons]
VCVCDIDFEPVRLWSGSKVTSLDFSNLTREYAVIASGFRERSIMFEEVMDEQIDLHELPVNEHRPTNKCELVGTQTNPDALRFMDVTSVQPFSLQRKRTPCGLGP